MLKKLLSLLAVICGLSTPTLAATSTYTVYPTASSVVCGSDAVCSTIKHLSVQTVTVSGTAGTALYTWNASCPSSPDAIFYIRPTGATTGCFVLEGFGPSTGGVVALVGTTNQITASAGTGSVTLSLSSTLIAPGTFSSTSLNVSGSTPSANGLYLPSANTLGVSVNSIQVGRFTSTGLNATNIGVTTPGTGSFTTLTSTSTVTETPRSAAYVYTNWSPSDVIGTLTVPSSTTFSQATATTYLTMANSSGTLTFTFTKAGRYLITLHLIGQFGGTITGAAYTNWVLGGTATRYINGPSDPGYFVNEFVGTALSDQNSLSFEVSATANQTLTVLPGIAVVSTGTTSQFIAAANATATYVGT